LPRQVFLCSPINALLSAALVSFDQALKTLHVKTNKFNALWIFSSLPQGSKDTSAALGMEFWGKQVGRPREAENGAIARVYLYHFRVHPFGFNSKMVRLRAERLGD